VALFTARFTAIWEQLIADQWSLTGRTTVFLPNSAKLINADRYHDQILTVSANVSAQALPWAPLGISAPSILLMFQADQPCDVRTNAPGDANFLSGVQLMYLAGHISNIYVTTGGTDTTIRLIACGGSAAALTTSLPLP
jgi:hypothetical protein